ncbi:MAG: thiamine pyrophosphate-dependent dehydrogenase E1 component subunit alpha [Kiritimatiellae bacterium]|nr:thiamine pyrophosphate-dependent dehydrogenase E1 component subunit alpha [Kiritimatiellia bacterium]
MYRKIHLIREFDTKVRDLWMANAIYGLAHAYVGAEAIAVGACEALRPDDCITSTHRGHGHTIAKGADVNKMMAELFGKYQGYNRGKGGSMHIADVEHGMLGATGIVGSGMPLAVGAAMAADVLENGRVALCFHGDGGTNQGVWHESINMAAAWNLPVVFLIENNQLAIATEIGRVSRETDLHKRAVGYGIPGIQVDGFNPFTVYEAVKEAAKRARGGQGPTLIEARILRLLGHFVADDQWYRDLAAVEPFWQLEPIPRMRRYLLESGMADAEQVDAIEAQAKAEIAEAVRYASEDCTEPPIETLYEDLYAAGEILK